MAKKKERKPFGFYFMLVFILVMMATWSFSVMLYAPPTPGSLEYNGFEFEADQQGRYVTSVDGREARFHNTPTVAATVPVDGEAVNLLRTAPATVVTFDPNSSQLPYVEITRFELANTFRTAGGITSPSDEYPLPLYDCVNASPQTPVLRIRQGDPNVTLDGYCITMSGNRTSLILAKDALLYRYHGVIGGGGQ